jgi:hypothetical protein
VKSNIETSVGYNIVLKVHDEVNIGLDTCTCCGMVVRMVYHTEIRNRRLYVRSLGEFTVCITGTVGPRSFGAPGGEVRYFKVVIHLWENMVFIRVSKLPFLTRLKYNLAVCLKSVPTFYPKSRKID